MECVYLDDQIEKQEFAKRAAKFFAENEKITTYTDEDIKAGCWFALRWGGRDDCVVVFKVDENIKPVNYMELVRSYIK